MAYIWTQHTDARVRREPKSWGTAACASRVDRWPQIKGAKDCGHSHRAEGKSPPAGKAGHDIAADERADGQQHEHFSVRADAVILRHCRLIRVVVDRGAALVGGNLAAQLVRGHRERCEGVEECAP